MPTERRWNELVGYRKHQRFGALLATGPTPPWAVLLFE